MPLILIVLVMLVLLIARAQPSTIAASETSPMLPMVSSVPLALFYRPLSDGTSVSLVAERFASAILTHGDESYRDQLRAAGFKGPILQYLVANEASGPADLRDARDVCSQYLHSGNDVSGIAQDFCHALHPHEEAFLHNAAGNRIYSTLSWQEDSGTRTRYYYLMNPGSTVWRQYFLSQAEKNARQMGYTGLFIDNIDRTLERGVGRSANSDGRVREFDSDEAYRRAVEGGLAMLRSRLGHLPLWGNVTTAYFRPNEGHQFTPYLDAVMNEYFVGLWRGQLPDPALWEAQLSQAEAIIQAERAFIAVAQGDQNDLGRLQFALASFLLVADERAYFRYTDETTYEQGWMYDDYRSGLGAPTGKRYRTEQFWQRDFKCGRVRVDPAGHRGWLETLGATDGCSN
ncbi:MAG: putative glycoside hydrolase [Chloroflexota bacterium]